MRMLNDNVLMEEMKDDVTAGGILMPESRQTEFSLGKVVAVGPGMMLEIGERVKVDIEVGDMVKYVTKKAYDIDVDGKQHKVTNESCIVGVI